MSKRIPPLALATLAFAVMACVERPSAVFEPPADGRPAEPSISMSVVDREGRYPGLRLPAGASGDVQEVIAAINDDLAARGSNIAIEKVEWVTGPEAGEAGQEVIANDRELRLPSRWVPGDTRRLANGDIITQLIYEPFELANSGTPNQIPAAPSIDASFDSWGSVSCSKLDLLKVPDTGVFPSAVFVGGDPFVADIVTLGFLPGTFFDLVLGPGASTIVLGVTFTFIFVDPTTGEPTDIDGNRRDDTALKEVWYNDNFLWSVGESPGVDIETVALHENGHALELGHFGRVVLTKKGRVHAAPRAVMNAVFLGVLRRPLGSDNGAFCSNFARWPN